MEYHTNMKINITCLELIVYDFDGVLTDNRVLVSQDGMESVFCNRSDGLAIEFIKSHNIPQIIISKETNRVVKARADKLKIEVIQGVDDKEVVLSEYCQKYKYSLNKTLYVGNDVNDIPPMNIVGYKVAPQDANEKVKQIVDIVLDTKGGFGVVQDLYQNHLT